MMQRTQEVSRVTRPREEAARAYDKVATWYYLVIDRLEHRCREIGLAELAVRQGESVLEIGFGTGSSIITIAQAVGVGGKVVGIDISDRMLSLATTRLEKAGLLPRVELVKGDAVNAPFPDDTFDAVFMSYVLELFDTPDIPAVLQVCRRVLRPGGRICVVALSKEGHESLATRIYEIGHRLLPRYLDCRPIYASRSVADAGFEIRHSEPCYMFGLEVEVVLADTPPL